MKWTKFYFKTSLQRKLLALWHQQNILPNVMKTCGGAWLAHSMQRATLGLRVMTSSRTLGKEITLKVKTLIKNFNANPTYMENCKTKTH